MRAMGYPTLKEPCPWCAVGKLKRAPSSTKPIEKGKKKLDLVYMDQKVSSKADRHDRTRMLGIVDSYSNNSWVLPLKSG